MVRDDLAVAPPTVAVAHGDDPDDPWVARWWSVSPRGDLLDAGRALLERVPHPRTFARCGGEPVPDAVGMAAVVDGWVGLGAIAVAAGARRRGLGRAITVALLAWGREHGAGRAFLQVSSDNTPGIALYTALGFRTAYDYRYWSRRWRSLAAAPSASSVTTPNPPPVAGSEPAPPPGDGAGVTPGVGAVVTSVAAGSQPT